MHLYLSRFEALEATRWKGHFSDDQLARLFEIMDTDQSGSLRFAEFVATMQGMIDDIEVTLDDGDICPGGRQCSEQRDIRMYGYFDNSVLHLKGTVENVVVRRSTPACG